MPFEEISALLETEEIKRYDRQFSPIYMGGWKPVKPKEELEAFLQKLSENPGLSTYPIYLALPHSLFEKMGDVAKNCVIGSGGMCKTTQGSFTEPVALKMLKSANANFVVLDLSEAAVTSNNYLQETQDALKKLLLDGIQTFLVVGESSEEFHQGKTIETIKAQLDSLLQGISEEQLEKLGCIYSSSWITTQGVLGLEKNLIQSFHLFRHILEEVLGPTSVKVRVLATIPHFHGSIYPYIKNTPYEGFYFRSLATQGQTFLSTLADSGK